MDLQLLRLTTIFRETSLPQYYAFPPNAPVCSLSTNFGCHQRAATHTIFMCSPDKWVVGLLLGSTWISWIICPARWSALPFAWFQHGPTRNGGPGAKFCKPPTVDGPMNILFRTLQYLGGVLHVQTNLCAYVVRSQNRQRGGQDQPARL